MTAAVFENIIENTLLKDKTFIITANNYKVLEYADRVIFLERGSITFNGTVQQFKNSNIDPNLRVYLDGKDDSVNNAGLEEEIKFMQKQGEEFS